MLAKEVIVKREPVNNAFAHNFFKEKAGNVERYDLSLNFDIKKYFKKNKSIDKYNDNFLTKSLIQSISSKGKNAKFKSKFYKFFRKFRSEMVSVDLGELGMSNFKYLVFNNLFRNLLKIKVFFKHSFHRIDKKIRKFSRGKSGKYTMKYNYVPAFKRVKNQMKSIKNEIKLAKGLTYDERFFEFFKTITYNYKNSFMFKNKKFAYKYIHSNSYNKILKKAM